MKRLVTLCLALCFLVATPAFLAAADHLGLTFGSPAPGGPLPVDSVRSGTPTALSGLRAGDLVIEVDGVNVKGENPQKVLDRIEDQVSSGRSSVLVYRRGNWKTAALIRPLRLSSSQEETLGFAEDFRTLHDRAGKVWNDACSAFNDTMKGQQEGDFFLEKVASWRESLRQIGQKGALMQAPSAVKGDLRRDLEGMTRGLSKQQSLRTRTLALMEDYLESLDESRRPASFSQLESPYEPMGEPQTVGERRWDRIVEAARKAHRSELRIQVLFRDAMERSGLIDSSLIDPVL